MIDEVEFSPSRWAWHFEIETGVERFGDRVCSVPVTKSLSATRLERAQMMERHTNRLSPCRRIPIPFGEFRPADEGFPRNVYRLFGHNFIWQK